MRDVTQILERVHQGDSTAAEELLERYEKEWGGNIDRIFREYSY